MLSVPENINRGDWPEMHECLYELERYRTPDLTTVSPKIFIILNKFSVMIRRALLASLSVGVAGCLSNGSVPIDQRADFSAEPLRQTSPESPGVVRATLENVGGSPLEVGPGPALLFLDAGYENLQWATDVQIDPGFRGERAVENATDGCWHVPEERSLSHPSIVGWQELAPGEAISDTYAVYTAGMDGPCLPPGSHVFEGAVFHETRDRAFVLSLEITSDERGSLGVDSNGPEPGPP
jgi:hypothetical protein